MVKKLPAMQETWVRSLGQEDPLEKEMATHSSLLAWRTPWTEKPGGLQSRGSQRVGHAQSDRAHTRRPQCARQDSPRKSVLRSYPRAGVGAEGPRGMIHGNSLPEGWVDLLRREEI